MSRRKMVVRIGGDNLTKVLTTGWHEDMKCIKGLPDDAQFVNMAYDVLTDNFMLLFESPSWPENPEGASYPWFDPVFERQIADVIDTHHVSPATPEGRRIKS